MRLFTRNVVETWIFAAFAAVCVVATTHNAVRWYEWLLGCGLALFWADRAQMAWRGRR